MAYQLHKTEDPDIPLFLLQKLEPLRGQYGDNIEVLPAYYSIRTDLVASHYGQKLGAW